jgi:hypothetical protein
VPLGLLGAGEPVGLGSVAGWGVARWKAWGQAAAVDVFFGLEVLDSDFRLSFFSCHFILLSGCFASDTAPRDRTTGTAVSTFISVGQFAQFGQFGQFAHIGAKFAQFAQVCPDCRLWRLFWV